MPKRKFEDEGTIETGNVDDGDFSDADSEDENSKELGKQNRMDDDDIEGQEDPTVDFDGDVRITPFNMKEEMEEGHFDREGMYIFNKKDKNEIKDHWLDNIDWVQVKSSTFQKVNENSMESTEDPKPFDSIQAYKDIIEIVLPGETVAKALKRLGGGKVQTASERWKKKQKDQNNGAQKKDEGNKEQLLILTGLADSILSNTGNMDVYQETYEAIRHKIQKSEKQSIKNPDAELDMFGECFDEKLKPAVTENSEETGEPATKRVRFSEDDGEQLEEVKDQVRWEFKWENKSEAEVHGPYTSQEMQSWVEEGYFDTGVWVRRIGQEGEFYSSRRIDFELYI